MKIKTSVTLSADLLRAIDEHAGPQSNRSQFIEDVVRAYLQQVLRQQRDASDLATINRLAGRLNEEAADVLSYQVLP